jgi:cell wall-associated NlpC family hydrolase
MKKLIIILALALILAVWGPDAYADTPEKNSNPKQGYSPFIQMLIDTKKSEDLRIKNEEISNQLKIRTEKINNRIAQLQTYVGRTTYVFSGSSPKGWDCSGLVKWFHADLGVDLYHSAAIQMLSGNLVQDPLPGDIVSFTSSSGKVAYHNGIYIGDGFYIHSPKPGVKTKVSHLSSYGPDYPGIVFTRIEY